MLKGMWVGASSCGHEEGFWEAGCWGPEAGSYGNVLFVSQGKKIGLQGL